MTKRLVLSQLRDLKGISGNGKAEKFNKDRTYQGTSING